MYLTNQIINIFQILILLQYFLLTCSLHDNIKSEYIIAGHYCPLFELGRLYQNDKIISHNYGNLYCELMQQFRHKEKKVKMLEIGFGCGHHNHGTSAQMWKKYFQSGSGPDVSLYEIDFGTHVDSYRGGYEPHEKCKRDFLEKYPLGTIVDGLFLGDQSNHTFLYEVLNMTGSDYDIIIDDGGHTYNHMLQSFIVLWPNIVKGGVYFIEDLQVSNSKDEFIRHILGWNDQLMSNLNLQQLEKSDKNWVKWPSSLPKVFVYFINYLYI